MNSQKEVVRRKFLFIGISLLLIFNCSFFSILGATNPLNTTFNQTIIDTQGPDAAWLKTVGDLNKDGLVDLIVGGHNSGGLVWYKNPNWEKQNIDANTGFNTDGEVVDVDKDGDNDIVALSSFDVRWYEAPNWEAHVIDDLVAHDIETNDFDRDGDIDIVARDQGGIGNKLHFYRQDNPTTWVYRSLNISIGEGLDIVDVDRDLDFDIIIGGFWFENTKNIVGGAWTAYPYTTSWTHLANFVSTGDINNDGRVDIVLSPSEWQGGSYRISWFEAPPNAKTVPWTEHKVDENVETVHHFVGTADFDNDGDVDIATAEMEQGANPDEVKIYFNGDGKGLTWVKQVISSSGSHSMRVLDFDQDSDFDLLGANWESQQVDLFENQVCPTSLDYWQRYVIDASKPDRAVFITSGDLDGDQQEDIIAGGWWYKNPSDINQTWQRSTIGLNLNNMALVADFDKDGYLDILGTQGSGSNANSNFLWAHNSGNGTFVIKSNIESGEGDFLQGVAFDGIGSANQKKVYLSWHGGGQGIQSLTIPSNPLITTWTWERISPVSQDEDLDIGDIDRDGDLDLLLGTLWLENDDGTWTQQMLHNVSGSNYGAANPDRNQLIDMNGDSRLDAIVGYEAISTIGKLAWYEQGINSTSLWSEHIIASDVVGPMSLDADDMDFDGDIDVVVGEHNLASPSNSQLFVFENVDGFGESWQKHLVYKGDEHHDGAQLTDIDDDGDLDIISIGWENNKVLLYENQMANCSQERVFLPGIFKVLNP